MEQGGQRAEGKLCGRFGPLSGIVSADQRRGPFKQSFDLKIKGDLIPEADAEEMIGEIQALFYRHNAGVALTAKALFKPTKEFHTARHTLYSAEENMEIDKVVPVAASVKTKLGRGGTGEV